MVEFKAYGSWDEMMEAEQKAREVADSRVQDWQKKARSGDVIVSAPYEDLICFHELLDNEALVKKDLWERGDLAEDEGIYILDLYNEPHMENYRFCKSYSAVVPYGELGDIHLSIAIGKLKYIEDLKKLKASDFCLDEPIEITR